MPTDETSKNKGNSAGCFEIAADRPINLVINASVW